MSDLDALAYWHDRATAAEQVADRLRAALDDQRRLNLQLADRLAACSAVLSRAAERGKACDCLTRGATA